MLIIILLTQLVSIVMAYLCHLQTLTRRFLLVFNIWWGVLLIYSSIVPFGGYHISNDAYILIWLFLLVFNTVFIFTKNVRTGRGRLREEFNGQIPFFSEEEITSQYDSLIINNKVISIAIYGVTVVLIYYAVKFSSIMTIDTFLNARNERFFVGGLFGSTLEILFYNYIVSAFRFFFSFVIAFSILFGRMKTRQFIICVVDLALYSYIGSSRLPVVLLLVNLLSMWMIRSHYAKKKIDQQSIGRFLRIIAFLFLGIFGMSYLTAFRRGALTFSFDSIIDNFDILYQQILEYSIGPLSGLSYLYDNGIMINHWFFGRAVLINGIEEVISHGLGFAGIHFEYAKNVLGTISNVQYDIGTAQINALFTCIYWFFSDFGFAGVVLFTGVFAWVEKKGISKFVKQPSVFSLMFVIHILYYMFLSNMIWQINNVDSLLYMLFIYLFYRRAKNKRIIYGDVL